MFAAACCILIINFSFFFFAFLSPPKCMHQSRMVIVLYQRSSLLPTIKWLYSCIHTSFLKQGRDDSTLSSLRAYEVYLTRVHPQPNGSTHLLLRHPLLRQNITRYVYEHLSSCAAGFERIFTCMCESFFYRHTGVHNGLLSKRHVPPSEGKSCIPGIYIQAQK